MQSNAISKTCARLDYRATDHGRLIREWLVKFGAIYGRDITPLLVASWEEALAHVQDLPQLERAFLQAARTCRQFMPTPADVLAPMGQAEGAARRLDGERAWRQLEQYIERYFLGADVGLSPRAPSLPAAIDYAQRAAGGLPFIESCSREDLVWAKKRFLEAHETYSAAPELHALATGEARKLLAECARRMEVAPRPALPVPTVASAITEAEAEERRQFSASLRGRVLRAVEPKPEVVMSEEDLRATAAAQQAALRKHADVLCLKFEDKSAR